MGFQQPAEPERDRLLARSGAARRGDACQARAVDLPELDQQRRDVAQAAALARMLDGVRGCRLAVGELQVPGRASASFGWRVRDGAAGVEGRRLRPSSRSGTCLSVMTWKVCGAWCAAPCMAAAVSSAMLVAAIIGSMNHSAGGAPHARYCAGTTAYSPAGGRDDHPALAQPVQPAVQRCAIQPRQLQEILGARRMTAPGPAGRLEAHAAS